MLSRFHLVPERNGQTDRFAISISRVSMLTRDKKYALSLMHCTRRNVLRGVEIIVVLVLRESMQFSRRIFTFPLQVNLNFDLVT